MPSKTMVVPIEVAISTWRPKIIITIYGQDLVGETTTPHQIVVVLAYGKVDRMLATSTDAPIRSADSHNLGVVIHCRENSNG